MALLSLSPGNHILPFIGATTTAANSQSWFTAANADVYAVSANGLTYAKNAGGSDQNFAPAPSRYFQPASNGLYSSYILVVRLTISVDGTLFGIPAATAAVPDTGVFVAPAAVQTEFSALVTSRFQFGSPSFTLGAGTVAIQLGTGVFQTYDLFNSAMTSLSDAQIQAANLPFIVRLTQTNSAAATVEMAIS